MSKHQISPGEENERLTRDGTAGLVPRDRILRGERGDRENNSPVQLTTSRYVMTILEDGRATLSESSAASLLYL